jgi:hypothetical protein
MTDRSDRPLPDRIRTFLDDERFATISTIDPDGAPRQAVVWYTLMVTSSLSTVAPVPLADQPPARPADRVLGGRCGGRAALGRVERNGPIDHRAPRRRPTSPGWRAATMP